MSKKSWREAEPGDVFKFLARSEVANPLVFVDELDKPPMKASGGNSPDDSLLALLEETSNGSFRDEYLGIELDASMFAWVFAGNSLKLPDPLLSRLTVFNIEAPSRDEVRLIGQCCMRQTLKRFKLNEGAFSAELPTETLDMLSVLTPREVRLVTRAGMGHALVAGRKELTPQDIAAARGERVGRPKQAAGFMR